LDVNIAVFSDLHGRILLCFLLCARWERETGRRIDFILQAGDLGAFPERARLDRATINHAREDPTELGFLEDFARYRPDVAAPLGATTCPLLFVRGNHEDHAWLDALEAQAEGAAFPVDAYGRIFCLKTGALHRVATGDGASLSLLGIGRIGAPAGKSGSLKPKYIQEREVERLYDLAPGRVNVLLTHDVPPDRAPPGLGMEEIRLTLDARRPRYHFYGHTEQPYECQRDANGATTAIRLADLNWEARTPGRPLVPGVMGILRWDGPDDHAFEVVDAPWLRDYRAATWRRQI